MYIITCWSTYNVEELSKHPMQVLFFNQLPNVRDGIPLYKVPQSFHPPMPLMVMPMIRLPIATYYRDPKVKYIKHEFIANNPQEKLFQQYNRKKGVVPSSTSLRSNENVPYYFQHIFSQVGTTFY